MPAAALPGQAWPGELRKTGAKAAAPIVVMAAAGVSGGRRGDDPGDPAYPPFRGLAPSQAALALPSRCQFAGSAAALVDCEIDPVHFMVTFALSKSCLMPPRELEQILAGIKQRPADQPPPAACRWAAAKA